jgi:transcriptional regulator with XRE-family HTH domain
MTPAHLLRAARRMAGVSQRELARRAGVEPRTVADIERGASNPKVATLAALLEAAGAELTLDIPAPEPSPALEHYLRWPLTQRLFFAVGGKGSARLGWRHAPWHRMWALRRLGDVLVTGEAAAGAWVRVVTLRPTVRVFPFGPAPLPDSDESLEVLPTEGALPTGAVPVPLSGLPLFVLPPHLLSIGDESPEHRAQLRAAAALLDARGGTDDADRAPPAHRSANHRRDEYVFAHTKRFRSSAIPNPESRRGWRLDGPVSFAQWLVERGHQP